MDGQGGGRKRRLSAVRKRDLVLSMLKGADAAELSRKHGVSQTELFRWRDGFLEAGQEGLKSRRNEKASGYEREIWRLQRVAGELTLESEILREAAKLRKEPYRLDRDKLGREMLVEGASVIATDQGDLAPLEVVQAYKELVGVERAFRQIRESITYSSYTSNMGRYRQGQVLCSVVR